MLAPPNPATRNAAEAIAAAFPAPLRTATPLIVVSALAALLVALDPTVFVGGGYDDWHYLKAAACAADQGYCVARDHWSSRFPVVLPTGAAIAMFGKTKAALAIVPAAYAIAAIMLLTGLVQRQFGRVEAMIAGLVFVATPVISDDLVRLAVDLPELCYLLGAVACLQQRIRGGGPVWPLVAGVALGLAIETRATSLVAVPIFAIALMLLPVTRRDRLSFGLGLGAILAAQAAVDAALTGDLLHQWRLQLAHTTLNSSELPAAAAASGPPIFNVGIIDAWAPASGIAVHWTVDGLLNLLAHPDIGLTMAGGVLLLAANLKRLHRGDRPLLLLLAGAAALWFGGLVYGLAIDPKPRMFEPVVAVAAVCIGVVAGRRFRDGEPLLAGALATLIVGSGTLNAVNSSSLDPAVEAAVAEVRSRPEEIAVDNASLRFLASHFDDLPLAGPETADRLLTLAPNQCPEAELGWRLDRWTRFERAEPRVITDLRGRTTILPHLDAPALCVFTRKRLGSG